MATGKPTDPDPRRMETTAALNSGAIHLLRALHLVDRRTSLTPARLSALSVLVFGGPCSLGELARTEDVASSTMTRIADGLVAAGLARRSTRDSDQRVVELSATPKGRRLMLAARDRRLDALDAAMAALTPAQRRQLDEAAPAIDVLATALRMDAAKRPQPTPARTVRRAR